LGLVSHAEGNLPTARSYQSGLQTACQMEDDAAGSAEAEVLIALVRI